MPHLVAVRHATVTTRQLGHIAVGKSVVSLVVYWRPQFAIATRSSLVAKGDRPHGLKRVLFPIGVGGSASFIYRVHSFGRFTSREVDNRLADFAQTAVKSFSWSFEANVSSETP